MREAADVLRAEIRRLGGLVSDFLSGARPKPLVLVDCDLNDLASGVRSLLAPEAEARKVSLAVEAFPFPVSVRDRRRAVRSRSWSTWCATRSTR